MSRSNKISSDNNFRRTWRIPLLLGLSIAFGLLSALLGTGVWHGLSWISLGIPLIVIAWKLRPLMRTGIKRTPNHLHKR